MPKHNFVALLVSYCRSVGVLSAGLAVDRAFLQIPPGEEAFLGGGWCPGECLEEVS